MMILFSSIIVLVITSSSQYKLATAAVEVDKTSLAASASPVPPASAVNGQVANNNQAISAVAPIVAQQSVLSETISTSPSQTEFPITDSINDLGWLNPTTATTAHHDSNVALNMVASMEEPSTTMLRQLEMMPGQRRFDELALALEDSPEAAPSNHRRHRSRFLEENSLNQQLQQHQQQLPKMSRRSSLFDDEVDAFSASLEETTNKSKKGRRNNSNNNNRKQHQQHGFYNSFSPAMSSSGGGGVGQESREQMLRPFVGPADVGADFPLSSGENRRRSGRGEDIFSNDGTLEDEEAERRSDDDDDEIDDGDELEEVAASAARNQRMQSGGLDGDSSGANSHRQQRRPRHRGRINNEQQQQRQQQQGQHHYSSLRREIPPAGGVDEGSIDYDENTDSSAAVLVRDRVRGQPLGVAGISGLSSHNSEQQRRGRDSRALLGRGSSSGGGSGSKKQQMHRYADASTTGKNQLMTRTADQAGGASLAGGGVNEFDSDQSASYIKNSQTDLSTAAGHHHGHSHGSGHYYEYRGVPKKKAWKFGFHRGNHKHEIERHEKGYKNKFHSTFKWHATEKCKKKKKCKSMGSMKWEYKHHDKKKKHGHHYGK